MLKTPGGLRLEYRKLTDETICIIVCRLAAGKYLNRAVPGEKVDPYDIPLPFRSTFCHGSFIV